MIRLHNYTFAMDFEKQSKKLHFSTETGSNVISNDYFHVPDDEISKFVQVPQIDCQISQYSGKACIIPSKSKKAG